MKLKKVNAAIGLLIVLALGGHAGTMGYSLWTGWYSYVVCKMLARLTVSLVSVHVILTLVEYFFFHDGSEFKYKNYNWSAILQRATAIAMIVLLHIHMKAYAHVVTGVVLTTGQTVFFCVEELLFFAAVLSHAAVSVSKGVITLGLVSTPRAILVIDRICYVSGAFAMLAVAGGMLSFFLL
ncbi:MAG: hypothetical protein ACI4EY_02940 [Lachnospiraceae bacterium]